MKDLPLTLSVVPASLLRDQDAFVLTDALKNASGVNVGTGFGVFDYFVVRGIDSLTGGLVLTDGAPEPESTFYPLYNVRQVEVLKGPSGFLYGGNPLAGAVQMVRKQPVGARFAEGSLTYGRFGTFAATVDGNAATEDGRLSFRLNGAWQGTDQYRDLPEGSIQAVNPTLLFKPDDRTRLLFGFEYVKSDQPPDTGLPFVSDSGSSLAQVPRTTSYQSPYDGSTQDVYRVRFDAGAEALRPGDPAQPVLLHGAHLGFRRHPDQRDLRHPGPRELRRPHPGPARRHPEAPGRPARAGLVVPDGPRGTRAALGRRASPGQGRVHPGRGPAVCPSTC